MYLWLFVTTIVLYARFCYSIGPKLAQQRIQSYQTCTTDADCKKNAFCYGNDDNVNGKCKCLEGFELIRNTTYYECLSAVQIGDACENNIQCTIKASSLARCNKYNICECNEESQNYNGICLTKVKIGGICLSDGNCYLNDDPLSNSYCYKGKCECNKDQVPSQPDLTKCVAKRNLQETCNSNEECLLTTPNSQCINICVCGAKYTLSRNLTSCVEVATQFGDKCEFDGQCSKFLLESICNNGTCGCNSGYHDFGVRCIRTKKIGESCQEDTQCWYDSNLVKNCKCIKGVCQCLYGKKSDNTCNIQLLLTDANSSSLLQNIAYLSILLLTLIVVL